MPTSPKSARNESARAEAVRRALAALRPETREYLAELNEINRTCSQEVDRLEPGEKTLLIADRRALAYICYYIGKAMRRTAPSVFKAWEGGNDG